MKPFSDKPSVAFEPIERSRAFEVNCDQIQECLAAGSLVPGMIRRTAAGPPVWGQPDRRARGHAI